jgi:hypothetical protein
MSRALSRPGAPRKKSQGPMMIYYGVALGLVLIVAVVVIAMNKSSQTQNKTEVDTSLKAVAYDEFADEKDKKLLDQLVAKHHAACVAASKKSDGTVDSAKYRELIRERITKDLDKYDGR